MENKKCLKPPTIYIYTMGSNKYKHPMMGIPIDSWKILTIPIMGTILKFS